MSDIIATYSFLPWLRQGITNKITTGDLDPAVKFRATIKVDLTITGGTPPYTIRWSNDATTEDLTDLPAGYYQKTACGPGSHLWC